MSPKRISRRERNKQKQGENQQPQQNFHIEIPKFQSLTPTQEESYQEWTEGQHIALIGSAGTGKTYIALWMALYDVLVKNYQEKIIVIRSAVPTRNMGFMPGIGKEKMSYFENPYIPAVNKIAGRGDAYGILSQKKILEFESTSYLRGITFNDSIIIVDECQSMNFVELDTIMTRLGNNSRIIFCGDGKQDDLTNERTKEKSGLSDFISILENIDSFSIMDFTIDDIVRSGIVKEYLIAKERQGL